jgi:hypothetical protein
MSRDSKMLRQTTTVIYSLNFRIYLGTTPSPDSWLSFICVKTKNFSEISNSDFERKQMHSLFRKTCLAYCGFPLITPQHPLPLYSVLACCLQFQLLHWITQFHDRKHTQTHTQPRTRTHTSRDVCRCDVPQFRVRERIWKLPSHAPS